MKSNGLVKKIVGAVLSLLAFIGLALPFCVITFSMGDESHSETGTWQEWLDTIESGNKVNWDEMAGWNASKVFYIILFVLLSLVAVALIVSIFVDNKIFIQITKWVAVASLIVAILSIVTMLIGGIMLSSSGSVVSTTYLPSLGAIVVSLLGIIGTSVAISACSVKKSKKSK